MDIIKNILGRVDISKLSFKKPKEEKKPTLLKELIDKPEEFKLEAFIENGEIIVKIKRKES